MTYRIGLGIARNEVRAIAVRRGAIAWHDSEAVADEQQIGGAIERLLARVPKQPIRRRCLVAAIGPSRCQVKQLARLPATRNSRLISSIIAGNASRFFIDRNAGLLTNVALVGGAWWGAAFDKDVVEAANAACAAAGFTLTGCVPTVTTIAAGYADGIVLMKDGAAVVAVTIANGCCIAIGRRGTADGCETPAAARALTALGSDAGRFADAFTAAIATRPPFLVRPAQAARHTARHPLRRAVAVSALVVSLVALLVAPGIAASRARGSADVALQSLTRRAEPAIAAEAEARRLSIALEQIARFSASRRPMLLLLGRVSTALPDSTAVVSLRVDSTGGNMIVMSPVGVMPLAEIDSIAGLKGAQIVGAVTRESVGGVELQRQAIRFTLARGRRSVPREGAP